MRTTFFGLDIVRKGLQTQQRALDVTGHNIANANTPGYTRQSTVIGTTTPWTLPGMSRVQQAGQVGTGSQVEEIRRIRDAFIDLQVRNENKALGYWEARADVLQKLEVVLNEPSDSGLRTVLDQFWESLQELSKNPESQAVRATVRQRGIAVADTFNHIYRQLGELQEDITATVKVKVEEFNSLSTQIRDLNDQIVRVEVSGDKANDLRDRRDNLLDQLSKIADIRYSEDQNGAMRVTIGGKALVMGNRAFHLAAVEKEDIDGVVSVQWQDGTPLALTNGELLGYIEAMGFLDAGGDQRGLIPDLLLEINHLANSIVTAVNKVHQAGYPLEGDKGILFFHQEQDGVDPGKLLPSNARTIRVSDAVSTDPGNIAASTSPNLPGDGANALKLAQLKHAFTVKTSRETMLAGQSGQLVQALQNLAVDPAANIDEASVVTWSLAPGNYTLETQTGVGSGTETANGTVSAQHWARTDIEVALTGFNGAAKNVSALFQLTAVDLQAGTVSFAVSSWETRTDGSPPGQNTVTFSGIALTDLQAAGGYTFDLDGLELGLQLNDAATINNLAKGDRFIVNYTGEALADGEQVAVTRSSLEEPAYTQTLTFNFNPDILADEEFQFRFFTMDDLGNIYDGEISLQLTGGIGSSGQAVAFQILPFAATIDDFYRGLIGQLGINTQEAERMALNQEMLVGQQMNRREIMSGVSLDEEMTNMIMFQHAYNAAARAITVMDEMLEVLINRVGLAGR